MPNLKDIRKRIASVKSTQQITRAMKAVAGAKLRKATEAALSARAYSGGMEELFHSIVGRMEGLDAHPAIAGRPEVRNAAVVVLSSDRGLCGSFNSGLFREVERFVWEQRDRFNNLEKIELFTYGKKSRDFFTYRKHDVARAEISLHPTNFFQLAQSAGRDLMRRFEDGELDRVYLAYNVFQSALVQKPTIIQLFPLGQRLEGVGDEPVGEGVVGAPEFEPSQAEVFDALVPKYLDTILYQAFLESEAGEHGSRMTAMDAATRNAGEMIDRLTMQYNRARQAAITTELVEIISGAEAL
jgi:F-type H+-transporting ATPase subunit gamma